MALEPYRQEPEQDSGDQGPRNRQAEGQPDHPTGLRGSHVLKEFLCMRDGPHEAHDRHAHDQPDQGGHHDQVPIPVEAEPGTQLSEAMEVV